MKNAIKQFIGRSLDPYAEKLSPYSENLGLLTLIFGVMITTIGFSFQVYKNYMEKTCGISGTILFIGIILFIVRIPYSASKKAWHLLPADLFGILICFVLTWQWIIY